MGFLLQQYNVIINQPQVFNIENDIFGSLFFKSRGYIEFNWKNLVSAGILLVCVFRPSKMGGSPLLVSTVCRQHLPCVSFSINPLHPLTGWVRCVFTERLSCKHYKSNYATTSSVHVLLRPKFRIGIASLPSSHWSKIQGEGQCGDFKPTRSQTCIQKECEI